MDQPLKVYTHLERPELASLLSNFGNVWPQFIFHDAISDKYDALTLTTFAHLNLYLCDEKDDLVAAGKGVSFYWNGEKERLPGGWDSALVKAVSDKDHSIIPNTFCALAAMVKSTKQGQGLSKYVLRAMKSAAKFANLTQMIAPVRPTLKEHYPLISIERYLDWKHVDGSPFDPWLRIHWREGAKILGPANSSMRIVGTVKQWEEWTGMAFPQTGDYIVPKALCPISINYEADQGVYIEPNVWMQHPL